MDISNRNALVFSPQINYTFLTKKKDLIELGIGLFKVGNKIAYYDNSGGINNAIFNTNQIYGLPLSFYKNMDKKNDQFYMSAGMLFGYNFSKSVFTTQ